MPANDPKVYEPVVLDQTENNQLSLIADAERKKLITRNDFKKNADEYGVTNPQALADGDDMGKGTGVFLDTQNGGSNSDILERKTEIKINEYQPNKPYTTPSA